MVFKIYSMVSVMCQGVALVAFFSLSWHAIGQPGACGPLLISNRVAAWDAVKSKNPLSEFAKDFNRFDLAEWSAFSVRKQAGGTCWAHAGLVQLERFLGNVQDKSISIKRISLDFFLLMFLRYRLEKLDMHSFYYSPRESEIVELARRYGVVTVDNMPLPEGAVEKRFDEAIEVIARIWESEKIPGKRGELQKKRIFDELRSLFGSEVLETFYSGGNMQVNFDADFSEAIRDEGVISKELFEGGSQQYRIPMERFRENVLSDGILRISMSKSEQLQALKWVLDRGGDITLAVEWRENEINEMNRIPSGSSDRVNLAPSSREGHVVYVIDYNARGIVFVNSYGLSFGIRGFAFLSYDYVLRNLLGFHFVMKKQRVLN